MRAAERERSLKRLRGICLALPEVEERPSHGAPTFFVRGKKPFAGDGVQALLVDADPERFFVPPYVGHRGWLGVRLDRDHDWDELAGICEDAYCAVAPKRLVDLAATIRP